MVARRRQAIESLKPIVRDPSLFETQRTKDFQDFEYMINHVYLMVSSKGAAPYPFSLAHALEG